MLRINSATKEFAFAFVFAAQRFESLVVAEHKADPSPAAQDDCTIAILKLTLSDV